MFSLRMGVPCIREGFIRRADAHTRALTDTLVQKTFFGQLLYTSAVAMVTQVRDPAEARDWLERSEGEEGRGTLLEGYRGARGEGQTQR